ncbi:putative ATPase [Frankia sp. AiPs1]
MPSVRAIKVRGVPKPLVRSLTAGHPLLPAGWRPDQGGGPRLIRVAVRLTLLDGVSWEGTPVVGDRPRALLAALAAEPGRPVRAERLVELIWRGTPPANAAKGLQVVVSRTRTACGADAVLHDSEGYRLNLAPDQVDSALLATLVAESGRLLLADPSTAARRTREALALADSLPPAPPSPDGRVARDGRLPADERGPLADRRRAAGHDLATARLLLARALSRTGQHAEAFPMLSAAHAEHPEDADLLADLLRSEAAARGPAAALERFEHYRRDLRERLGTSPGPALTRVQRDLLALDRPERAGIRHDATPLLGRQHDIDQLKALLVRSRVVSIVGPGGLGKTRLANLLARDSELPIVHVVGLVGINAPEDLLGEIGSALGVRDSIGERRVLTPAQRADLRTRIAARLSRGPTLLLLDNCEHLLAAVAELVAFLVATVADLRVLTTSRAPLAIGAERVYLLAELARGDAIELFGQRAAAARPSVRLDREVVGRIVDRLDGLPLAIELAAARVRAMSVQDIDRRLADRFTLLRGGDRSAPDRHRTLLAVIDWSWNLLGEPERRALRRLALFSDGFTLDAAEEVLGSAEGLGGTEVRGEATGTVDAVSPVDTVQDLVDQSLLSVRETAGGIRYRMLETVREFGRLRLAEAGEQPRARQALRAWAIGHASRHGPDLVTERQFTAIDAVAAEETNLADELRVALVEGDGETVVWLIAVLGTFWEIRGEHLRMMALLDAVTALLTSWTPPPRLVSPALSAVVVVARTALFIGDGRFPAAARALLARLGREADADPALAGSALPGSARVLLALDPARSADAEAELARLARDADRPTRLTCLVWIAHRRENSGAPRAAAAAATAALALATAQDGPWVSALLRTRLAELSMQLGDLAAGRSHAQAALPVLERLGARDDVAQMYVLLAIDAINDGRLDAADGYLARVGLPDDSPNGGAIMAEIGRAELAIARGEVADGLRQHLGAARRMRRMRLPGVEPTGAEPWAVVADAVSLSAFTWHADGAEDLAMGRGLFRRALARGVTALRLGSDTADYPVYGGLLYALGAWGLRRGDGRPPAPTPREAVELVALASRFSYGTMIPSMSWSRVEALAERLLPGALGVAQADGARPFETARVLVERLAARQPEGAADLPSDDHDLEAATVGEDRQRQEDDDHDEAGEQRPADLRGEHAVVGQIPGGGDQM